MPLCRVHRYRDLEGLAAGAAAKLVAGIAALQRNDQEAVNLCLSHGTTAELVYEDFARSPDVASLDTSSLAFWWNSENFVPPTDPERNATKTLGLLGRALNVVPAQTHPMPSKSGNADPDEAAFAYATELGDVIFDICMLGLGTDGHVAAIYPDHPSLAAQANTSLQVMGVSNAPHDPPERITLTLNAMNRSKQVWIFASGDHKAEAVAGAIGGDTDLPAALVQGTEATVWFLDEAAASLLPYHRCAM